MKKKITALFVCLLMIITCSFAGCASFSIDKVKYYNEVVAKVGDKNITRYDLLSAYNSYGYNYYVSQMGKEEDEAMSETLNLLIDRESLYQFALDEQTGIYKPTAYQVNEIVKTMFNNLDSEFDGYLKTAKEILNITTENDKTEDSSSDTAYKLEDYTYKKRATVKYVDGDYKIEYIVEGEPTVYEKLIDEQFLNDYKKKGIVSAIKLAYLNHWQQTLNIKEPENATVLYNKTVSLFAKTLISYEYYLRDDNGKAYNKDTDDLIYRYIKRTFDNQIKSQYLTNIQNYFLENENLSIEDLTDEYNYLYEVNKNLYSNDLDEYKSKMKDIGTDGNSVLFHPTLEDGTRFGYFIHTLINFDDAQKNAISAIKDIKDVDEDLYNSTYAQLVANTKVKARNSETGLVDEGTEYSTLANVIAEYNNIKNLNNYTEKLNKFVEFMFKYTGDTATLSAGMPYVVGTNGNSAMEEAFTNEAIKLMDTNNKGEMSNVDLQDIDSMCITSYGIHLIFYIGDVNSFDVLGTEMTPYIQSINKANDTTGEYNLYLKKINPLTNKTYFDMLFDKVYPAGSDNVFTSNTGYSDYEKEITEQSKTKHKVVKYTSKIKATKTSI